MNPRQALICIILKKLNRERTISAVYHLLKGKKSAQTIQDGSLFHVLSYFSLFPQYERSLFEQEIKELVDKGYLLLEEEIAQVTDRGTQFIETFIQQRPYLQFIDGWRFSIYHERVWVRLCLYIQTLSYVVQKENRFYPLTHRTDVQRWVKNHLPRHANERETQLKAIYCELHSFLKTCHAQEAFIFVQQLSGLGKTGLTLQQLSIYLHLDVLDVYLIHLSTLHRLYNELEQNGRDYPTLAAFIADLKKSIHLTKSAMETYELLKAYRFEEVGRIRRLKQSTIEDHIVEIALQVRDFSISPFVNSEEERKIIETTKKLQTRKLREIKSAMNDDVTYFQLRLVLARNGVDGR